MVSRPERNTAWMGDVRAVSSRTTRSPRMPTTISSRVLLSTLKRTRSYGLVMPSQKARRSTSRSDRVSNAETSSKERVSPVSSTFSMEPSGPAPTSHESMIGLALKNLSDTLTKKNSDYKVNSNEFSNFYFAAD